MDPLAALENMIEAIADGNINDATEALTDLLAWQSRGGFVPRLVDILNRHTN